MSNSEYNEDELVPPTWMNDELFLNIMKKYKNDDNLKVSNLKITPGSNKGDHFGSVIFRVNLDFSSSNNEESIALIVKSQPEVDGFKKEMLSDTPIFTTEIAMYSKIIPEVQKRLKSAGIDFHSGSEYVYHLSLPLELIVLTDITKQGFEMKRNNCTFEESDPIVRKLAHWHAATFLMIRENPGIIDLYNQSGVFMMDAMKFFDFQISLIVSEVPQWPGFEGYSKQFKNFARNYRAKLRDINGPSKNNFNVMAHGDFHQRNLMHKYKDGKLIDTAFLDFQCSCVTSPAFDIIYLLYMVLDDDARDNHRDEIINKYFEHFTITLKKLGYLGQVPSLLDLQLEILRCGPLEAFISYAFLGLFQINPSELDFNQLLHPDGIEMRKKVLNNPPFKKYLQRITKTFIQKGFIA